MARAKKSLGQNFLVDRATQLRIVEALEPSATDAVLEIGPGRGALTRHLAGRVDRLWAVELDDDLARMLRAELGDRPGVQILHGDILDLELRQLAHEPHGQIKVIGNIPYNITTPILFWLLEQRQLPALIVLMLQREVAERILAAPGDKAYGALSVGVRTAAKVERLFHVSRGSFRPVPDVDSTVIRVIPHSPPLLDDSEAQDVRTLTRTAFAWRRKQLQKTLRSAPGYGLSASELARLRDTMHIDLETRAETLSPDQFIALSRYLRQLGYPAAAAAGNPS